MSLRCTAFTALLLVTLVTGSAFSDSMWIIDAASCVRLHRYAVSGGSPEHTVVMSGATSCVTGATVGGGSLWLSGLGICNYFRKANPATGEIAAALAINRDSCITGITYGDACLWVVLDNWRIARISPSTGQIISIVTPDPLTPDPCTTNAVAYGAGSLWIVQGCNCGRIARIDPSSGAVLQRFMVSGSGCITALAYGDGHLWAAGLSGSDKVCKIDPANGSIVSTTSFGTGWPIVALAYEEQESVAPPSPVVIDDGAYTTSCDSLHAVWSSQPGIAECQYAIGTSPTELVVGWRSAGVATETNETGISLQPGVMYYWYVKARNAAGQWSGVGVSDGITSGTPVSISAAKSAPPGRKVILASVTVSARFDDCVYVESAGRSGGIKVIGSPGLSLGDVVDVVGTVEIISGEKSVRSDTCRVTGSGTIEPIGMSVRNIAVYGANSGASHALGTAGLCSAGLLVRTWGRVTARGDGFFCLDDGFHLTDITGCTGLRVLCEGLVSPPVGRLMQVTGVSTLFPHSDTYYPALRIRDAEDMTALD